MTSASKDVGTQQRAVPVPYRSEGQFVTVTGTPLLLPVGRAAPQCVQLDHQSGRTSPVRGVVHHRVAVGDNLQRARMRGDEDDLANVFLKQLVIEPSICNDL